jgi:ABC-2 type transport system permease protein
VLHRLRSQVIKELLSLLRDPRTRIVLIGPPLMQLFIFSFAATLDVQNIGLAILDEDSGRWSRELEARITSTRLVGTVRTVGSPQELRDVLDSRQVIAGLVFQSDFSRAVDSSRTARVQAVLDGRRANAAQIALGYLNAIVEELNGELGGVATVRAATTIRRHWFNPNLEYQWFTVPALVGMLSMFSALVVTALSIARERELGTFDQLLVSPAHPAEIIVGKCVPALITGTLLGSVMIAAAILAFRIPFTGSLWLVYAALTLFILSVVGVGLMISSVSQTQQQAILGAFAVGVPLVLLSGFATPVDNMPQILQWLAEANPLKHFLVIVQGSFLKALPASAVWSSAWPIAVIASVTLTAALVFVQRRLQ